MFISIFIEIDSLFNAWVTIFDSIGVNDSVFDKLLTKVDEVDILNNMISIYMAIRKDLIDKAIWRSERLELHIEILLPDEKILLLIFDFHTKTIKDNKVIDEKIDLTLLVKLVKNIYTGEDIEWMVILACSNDLREGINREKAHKVKMQNFFNAMEN